MQSKIGSFIEVCVNVFIGMVLSLITQLIVFPMYGIEVNMSTNTQILVIFTVVSIARSYVIRRWFNGGFKIKM